MVHIVNALAIESLMTKKEPLFFFTIGTAFVNLISIGNMYFPDTSKRYRITYSKHTLT